MAGVTNVSLTILLDRIAKNEYDIKVINNTQIKIQPKTCIKYTSIVKKLQVKNTDFHTK